MGSQWDPLALHPTATDLGDLVTSSQLEVATHNSLLVIHRSRRVLFGLWNGQSIGFSRDYLICVCVWHTPLCVQSECKTNERSLDARCGQSDLAYRRSLLRWWPCSARLKCLEEINNFKLFIAITRDRPSIASHHRTASRWLFTIVFRSTLWPSCSRTTCNDVVVRHLLLGRFCPDQCFSFWLTFLVSDQCFLLRSTLPIWINAFLSPCQWKSSFSDPFVGWKNEEFEFLILNCDQ